jgi:predicted PurR-regulated permease PerM
MEDISSRPGSAMDGPPSAPSTPSAARPTPRDDSPDGRDVKPAWVDQFVRRSLWTAVAVVLAAVLFLIVARELRHLLGLIAVGVFFALAIIPGVEHIHDRWRWRRGAAVGLIYACAVVLVVLMVLFLVPAFAELGDRVRTHSGEWTAQVSDLSRRWLNRDLVGDGLGQQVTSLSPESWRSWAEGVFGLASSGLGVVFNVATVAVFTFYFAADYPRIESALLSRLPPARQEVYTWVSDVSIQQTGGYFYSRLLLTLINATLTFAVMLVLGVSPAFALPLAVFMAFFAAFIPVIGTYVGAAVPLLVVLALQGLGSAVALLVWVLLYQWVENMFLAPRLSAKTMELNGAVAFGAALAGAALAGPMGAFMALPLAALLTSVVKNTGRRYEVLHRSSHGDASDRSAEAG